MLQQTIAGWFGMQENAERNHQLEHLHIMKQKVFGEKFSMTSMFLNNPGQRLYYKGSETEDTFCFYFLPCCCLCLFLLYYSKISKRFACSIWMDIFWSLKQLKHINSILTLFIVSLWGYFDKIIFSYFTLINHTSTSWSTKCFQYLSFGDTVPFSKLVRRYCFIKKK